jgi:hypothetical protein
VAMLLRYLGLRAKSTTVARRLAGVKASEMALELHGIRPVQLARRAWRVACSTIPRAHSRWKPLRPSRLPIEEVVRGANATALHLTRDSLARASRGHSERSRGVVR